MYGLFGIGGLVSGIIILIYDVKYTKKLLPEIKIKRSNFCFSYVFILIKSGIWNTVNKFGQIFGRWIRFAYY